MKYWSTLMDVNRFYLLGTLYFVFLNLDISNHEWGSETLNESQTGHLLEADVLQRKSPLPSCILADHTQSVTPPGAESTTVQHRAALWAVEATEQEWEREKVHVASSRLQKESRPKGAALRLQPMMMIDAGRTHTPQPLSKIKSLFCKVVKEQNGTGLRQLPTPPPSSHRRGPV